MDEPQLVVRRFTPTEAGVWRSIRIDALRNAPEAFGQTLEHAEQQPLSDFESTVSGPFPPFAAFDGDKVVGTAGFYILGGPKMSHRGVLWGMYVASAHRRRGVGCKLVAAVIDHARDLVDQVHLHVVTTNAAAYGFYRSMGFVT